MTLDSLKELRNHIESMSWTHAHDIEHANAALALIDREHAAPALQRYNEFVSADDDLNALERLRAFCSFAMEGQDWLDVEPFFAAVEAERAAWLAREGR